jgi:hypothetical protein
MLKSIAWVVCCVLLSMTAISAAEPNAKTPEKAIPAGGATPTEVFETFRKAVIADDWTTALAQFDEPSRQFLIVGMAASSYKGPFGETGKKLAQAHLTDEQKFSEGMANVMKLPRNEQNDAGRALAQYIKDAPKLCQEVTKLFREKKLENWMLGLENATLQISKEEADSAKGSMRIKTPGGGGSEPMNFRKIDGRWFLNYNG